jgi:hypothetical protein
MGDNQHMQYIHITPTAGLKTIEATVLPALKPLQQSDKCTYRRFSDHRIAIVQLQNAQALPLVAVSPTGEPLYGEVFILGLRHSVDWLEFVGLTDEQVCIVQNELNRQAIANV